jgi:hypothetical protein
MRETKIAPDLPTYSKLLDVCSRAAVHRNAGIADVSRIFGQLAHDGLAPNTMTLNAMLKVGTVSLACFKFLDADLLRKYSDHRLVAGLRALGSPRRCVHP